MRFPASWPNAAARAPVRPATSMSRKSWKEKTGDPSPMEEDMLDFAFDVRPTSRLSCQIKVSAELEGLTVTVPERQA